ncbi:polyprenyl synthetase family protein [Candidatus Riesia pediculicola]|uniref:Geranyltranstransferase n=1 Tax=Riesia pediculicola (strain USDA) TaxID=515618 RepID=D4G7Y0_RIEPU|nr:polyprenyl synthetase family protein [Candidatus Riesia pediculicola]ADD79557.1 geranyltranstransferase [Candidatus Riesia pediculicola USDA]ARC53695.1 hypothetical protein AOE55_00790 [Candidatus Riesia pediculicola]QOJ86340.1 polyprenyl synthetase family protein [Candidatus Riesia pediculicola]
MINFSGLSFHQKSKIIKKQVNDILMQKVRSFQKIHRNLINVIRYIIFEGKKIRSCFIYSVGSMLKVSCKQISKIAASVECMHAYSLIHDDLPSMDNDDIRRNKKSCHIVFGEANAILAGNALQALAFELLLSLNRKNLDHKSHLQIIRELTIAGGIKGICGGQSLDISKKKRCHMNIELLNIIYFYKTVSLIRASIRMIFYASRYRYEKKLILILDDYSENIGLLFQIADDLIDFKKDKLKSQNQNKNKITYPILIGIDQSKKSIKNLYKKSIRNIFLIKKKYGFNIDMLCNVTDFILFKNK